MIRDHELSWEEKGGEFERAYFQGRCSKDIIKYVPAKLMDAILDVYTNSDGYWIGLQPGWTAYDGVNGGAENHCIHEYSIKDLKQALKMIRRE